MYEVNISLSKEEESSLLEDLRAFKTERDIDEAFKNKKITSYGDKVHYLHKCSGFDVSYNTPNYESLTSENKYIHELKIFVEKLWEISDFYKKR